MGKELETMRENYKSACAAYVRAFEAKQGIEFEYWIGEEVGGATSFGGEWCFSMLEIIHDVDTRQPKGQILQWHSECLEHAQSLPEGSQLYKKINYRSYCMGLRFGDLK